ncbi:MAG: GntR family transcriptional regulator [Turicibacter sp.]|nr:GntR family transcriptional regulator [Turicibacter sp.]
MLKYQKIAKHIEEYIEQNSLKQGDKLPRLEEFVAYFDAGKSTIRRSLSLLENKGILYQQHGSGIFVRTPKERGYIDLSFNRGFAYEFSDYELSNKLLAIEIREATDEVAKNLNITTADKVHYVKRLIFVDKQPLCIEESHYLVSVIPYLDAGIASASIFAHLQQNLNLKFGFSDAFLVVDKLNKEEAKLLELKTGDPRPCLINTFYLSDRTPFNYSNTVFHYQQSKFFVPVVKNL